MPQVIGVRFRDSAKVYYFSPEGANDLVERDYVIVETVRGQEAGIVAFLRERWPRKTFRASSKGS
jgi:cell fate regulator YaaT (PSP1 superfamily)